MKNKINYTIKTITFALLTVLFLYMNQANTLAASENLLLNPDFKDFDGSIPTYWRTTTYSQSAIFNADNNIKYKTFNSIKIESHNEDDARLVQDVTVKPNTIYKFTAYVKTKDVSSNGNGANLAVINTFSNSNSIKDTQDWTQLEMYLKSGEKQTKASISLALGGYSAMSSGTVWFANPSLIEANDAKGVSILSMDPASLKSNNNSNNSENTEKDSNLGIIIGIIISIIVIVAIIFINKKKKIIAPKTNNKTFKNTQISTELPIYEKTKITKIDVLIMVAITILYSILSFVNLGSTDVPKTAWTASQTGEKIEIELSDTITANRIGLYLGYGTGKYKLSCIDTNNKLVNLHTFEQGVGEFYIWKHNNFSSVTTNKLILEVLQHNNSEVKNSEGNILELALYNFKEKVKLQKPLKISTTNTKYDSTTVNNLFDEQDKVVYSASYMDSTYFDEIYHARTAYENNHEYPVYEWTHPPLGKYFIAIGMKIFGENPFGWRIAGAFFGSLMLPLIYLFALKLFKKRFFAIASMILFAVDFMHFSQSRISTIDVYGTFFVLLMYLCIYDYFTHKSIAIGYKKSLIMLLITGIAFGLGCASKWIGVYAGGGLAVLFFWTKFDEYNYYSNALQVTRGKLHGWLTDFNTKYIYKTCAWCVLFFVVIPITIYSLSYVPTYLDVEGETPSKIISNQEAMFTYHSKTVVDSTHPFSSKWYQWPTLGKPLLAYRGDDVVGRIEADYLETHTQEETSKYMQDNKVTNLSSSITIMGNPFIFWLSILFVPLAIFFAIKNKERGMYVVFVAIAFQYLPWVLVERTTYIYHFFSCVPFIILCIVYVFKQLFGDKKEGIIALSAYVALCTILFIMFYPVISGMPVSKEYIDNFVLWFKYNPEAFISWPF